MLLAGRPPHRLSERYLAAKGKLSSCAWLSVQRRARDWQADNFVTQAAQLGCPVLSGRSPPSQFTSSSPAVSVHSRWGCATDTDSQSSEGHCASPNLKTTILGLFLARDPSRLEFSLVGCTNRCSLHAEKSCIPLAMHMQDQGWSMFGSEPHSQLFNRSDSTRQTPVLSRSAERSENSRLAPLLDLSAAPSCAIMPARQ